MNDKTRIIVIVAFLLSVLLIGILLTVYLVKESSGGDHEYLRTFEMKVTSNSTDPFTFLGPTVVLEKASDTGEIAPVAYSIVEGNVTMKIVSGNTSTRTGIELIQANSSTGFTIRHSYEETNASRTRTMLPCTLSTIDGDIGLGTGSLEFSSTRSPIQVYINMTWSISSMRRSGMTQMDGVSVSCEGSILSNGWFRLKASSSASSE